MIMAMKNSIRSVFGGVVPGIMLFVLGVAAAPVVAAHATVSAKTLTVSGSAVASREPDRVTVRFGVETQQMTSAAALSANAKTIQSVVHALEKAGIAKDEISTSRFSIQAVYDNQQDRQTGRRSQVLTGYRVSNMLSVETDKLERVAAIIDSAVEAGVNRVDGVQFSLAPEVLADLKEQLIGLAVENARAKAKLALAPLNHVITGVQNVSLADFSAPAPMLASGMAMEMTRSAPTQIFSSDQEVRTSVQVTFLIGDGATSGNKAGPSDQDD
jgi:uncharacterized protein YggE